MSLSHNLYTLSLNCDQLYSGDRSLKVIIITTPDEVFHKYMCVEIMRHHEVVAVLHPIPTAKPRKLFDFEYHRNMIKKVGFPYYVLTKIGNNKIHKFGWDLSADIAAAETKLFPTAETDYEKKIGNLAHFIENINGAETVELIKSFNADVIVNSGGPIYRAPLIKATPLMLNYHTGISPIYNGSESIFWTFANGHPQITGGTLMVMDTGVDSGDMLAHYLPKIEADDTPGIQFMKTIKGGVELYIDFLNDLKKNIPYVGVPQGKPFHYTVSSEWSVHQNLMIDRYVKKKICKQFVRPEIKSIYWNKTDKANARTEAEAFLLKRIYNA